MIFNELNDFIVDVFNYYNGKINMVNKAVLKIDWARRTKELGISILPNIVTIYPRVAFNITSNISMLKINLLETIIHELYHTDQVIDYRLYAVDPVYKHNIETAVEVETATYIVQHRFEIARRFLVPTDNADITEYNLTLQYMYCNYYRRTWKHHIAMVISEFIGSEYFNHLYNVLDRYADTNGTVEVEINNVCVKVVDNGVPIPLEVFNTAFDYRIWGSSCDIKYHMGEKENSDNFKITLFIDSKHTMVRTI